MTGEKCFLNENKEIFYIRLQLVILFFFYLDFKWKEYSSV